MHPGVFTLSAVITPWCHGCQPWSRGCRRSCGCRRSLRKYSRRARCAPPASAVLDSDASWFFTSFHSGFKRLVDPRPPCFRRLSETRDGTRPRGTHPHGERNRGARSCGHSGQLLELPAQNDHDHFRISLSDGMAKDLSLTTPLPERL